MTPDHDQIWSCAFEVYPTREHERFGEYSGAFVNVFVLADSAEGARRAAVEALEVDHFIILEEEPAPVRLSETDWQEMESDFSEEFESVNELLLPESPVQYGTFHTFPKDGVDA